MPRHVLTILLLACVGSATFAQAPATAVDLPIREIDGGLYLRVELQAAGEPLAAHLLFDLAETEVLRLHARTAALLELDGGPVDVRLPGLVLSKLSPTVAGSPYLEELTAEHARALEEIPVVGVLGPTAFPRHFRIELDVDRGRARLLPKPLRSAPTLPPSLMEPPLPPPIEVLKKGQELVLPLLKDLVGLRLDARLGPELLAAALDTTHGDTTVDFAFASESGQPDLAFVPATVSSLPLDRYSALRPRFADRVASEAPVLLIGTRFLSHFLVVVDMERSEVRLRALAEPEPHELDAQVFGAAGRGLPDEMEKLLSEHEKHRGAADLARRLFTLRLRELPPSPPSLEKALEVYAKTSPARLRTRLLLATLEKLKVEAPELAAILQKKAIALALEHAEKDEDPEALHRARSELGLHLLLEGGAENLDQAYRYLLAAALAVPRDGLINFRLGLVYERLGKFERAWSRFLAAAIDAEAGPEGLLGLERLARERGLSGPSDVVAMERALSGRAPAFQPASTWKAPPGALPTRVVLVELFTHSRPEIAAAGELALEGLASHFEGAPVVLLNHHPGVGPLNPLSSGASTERARARGHEALPLADLDGHAQIAVLGRVDKGPEVFRKLRDAIETRLLLATPVVLSVTAGMDEAGRIRVQVRMKADAVERGMLQIYLTQKSVLFPGRSKVVFHRHLVRHDFLDGGQSVTIGAEESMHESFVTVEAIESTLEDHLDERESETNAKCTMRPTRLFRDGLDIVAWLETAGEVRQAATALVIRETVK